MSLSLVLTAFAALAVAAPEPALPDGMWQSTAGSKVGYHVHFSLHDVKGTSERIEARARVADGRIAIQARVASDSFDSGNKNRDGNARDAIKAAAHPLVELKGTGPVCAPVEGTCTTTLDAQLTFAGVKRNYQIPVTLKVSERQIEGAFAFTVLLSEHQIERPSLFFKTIDDNVDISGTLVMTPAGAPQPVQASTPAPAGNP